MKKPIIFFRFGMIEDVLKNLHTQPKEFLYGTSSLISNDQLTPIYVDKNRNTLLRKLLYYPEKLVTRTYLLGMPFEIVIENMKAIKNSKAIFCINDAISFAVLFFKSLGLINVPVITLFQSLSERHIRYFSGKKIAKKFIKFLLGYSDLILTLSSSSSTELIQSFDLDKNKVKEFYFGADKEFWSPSNDSKEDYILSVGNDSNRDFNTLIDALADDYKIKIVSRLKFNDHKNVEVLNGISNEELRDAYRKAKFVITPSRLILTESSGLSTTLQAMACGTPVIASDSLPFREFFEHNKSIFLYEPQNPGSLKEVVKNISEEDYNNVKSNALSLIEKKFNSESMEKQVSNYIEEIS